MSAGTLRLCNLAGAYSMHALLGLGVFVLALPRASRQLRGAHVPSAVTAELERTAYSDSPNSIKGKGA